MDFLFVQEERLQNNQFLFQATTSSIVEKELVFGNNSEPSQAFDTEINNSNKRRKLHRKLNIIKNEDNDDANFAENIDAGNSEDINTLSSETNLKQDLLPLSNNSSNLIHELLKNISNYNGEILNGGNLPINLFLGDNISVINYIALSPDSKENTELEQFETVKSYEISPIEGESNSENFHSLSNLEICTTQETTLKDISQTDLEVTQAVNSVIQLSESTTVSLTPLVTNIDNITINLTTFDLSNYNLTTQLPTNTNTDTEVITTTLVTELTTLDDSTCESDFLDNSLKPMLLTVSSTAATICITVKSSDVNNENPINTLSTTVYDSTGQPLDSDSNITVLSDSTTVTPIEQTPDIVTDATTAADMISTPASNLRKNKRSRLRSGETFGDPVKMKKSVKNQSTRAKKRRNEDLLKYSHKQNMEIEEVE